MNDKELKLLIKQKKQQINNSWSIDWTDKDYTYNKGKIDILNELEKEV